MLKSSVSILYTVEVEKHKSSEITPTVDLLSLSSMSFTLLTFVGWTDDLPHLSSSSTGTCPFLNRPCHLKIRARLHFDLVLELFITLNVSLCVFPSPTQNFITTLLSTFSTSFFCKIISGAGAIYYLTWKVIKATFSNFNRNNIMVSQQCGVILR